MKILEKALFYLYLTYLLIVPLLVLPVTSELFEFNKVVFTYLSTTIIVGVWMAKCVVQRKFIFRRTILDIPLLLFIFSQILSTILSIDTQTSLFGYYSRFNGGLLSITSYLLLYWAYVSNIDKQATFKLIKAIMFSSLLVSLYAISEHFGIDKNLWVQDVQNRVFSTLGQPNWLAAYLLIVLPFSWVFILKEKTPIRRKGLIYYLFSLLLFFALLFTKSRSGLLGFLAVDFFFWLLVFSSIKIKSVKQFILLHSLFLMAVLLTGTPWTPKLQTLLFKTPTNMTSEKTSLEGPILEVGGTESGTIRKIVWQGALNIWRHYPLIGSGVETFAYSYFNFRPASHNLVSEWDFLYNKAHNEYLNYLATTGTFGFISYIILICFSLFVLGKFIYPYLPICVIRQGYRLKIGRQKTTKTEDKKETFISFALLSGYFGILITNFFGFSVVVTSLYLFLYPAMALTFETEDDSLTNKQKTHKLNSWQIALLGFLSLTVIIVIFLLCRYWLADIYYARGKNLNRAKNYPQARSALFRAVKYYSSQPLYYEELSRSALGLSLNSFEMGDTSSAKLFAETSILESDKAITLSPSNVSFLKSQASVFIQLSVIDTNLLKNAAVTLEKATAIAPTDAKILYNLALVYARLQDKDKAIQTLKKAIELKANYKDARFALAIFYGEKGEKNQAKEQLNYILNKLSPDDTLVKQQLEEIK